MTITRVLFVDDEKSVLDGLRRQLRSLRHEWDMEFRTSGAEALALMDETPFDVVVSDMKMPSMDGAAFLQRVSQEHPGTVRIVLSGHAERDAILRTLGPAHQYLSKPCEPEELRETISRACALRRVTANESMRALVSKLDSLPSLPSLYLKVKAALEDDGVSRTEIGKIIETDLAMSTLVLKAANSSFFGVRRSIADVSSAIWHLGIDTVQALLLSAGVFRQFEGSAADHGRMEALWSHSLTTGRLARALAKAEGFGTGEIDATFAAALLHDVGKLVLLSGAPALYGEVEAVMAAEGCAAGIAEHRLMGTTHGEVGGYLMGLWGLPDVIVEGVAYHVSPAGCPLDEIGPVTLIHVADVFDQGAWAPDADPRQLRLDLPYLERVGAVDRVGAWALVCRESLAE